MTNEEICTVCFNNSLQVDKIIHIASMCYGDSPSSLVKEFFEDYADKVWDTIGLVRPEEGTEDDIEEIGIYLLDSDRQGFILEVSTPLPRFVGEDAKSYTMSWGLYTQEWVYGETFEEAFNKGADWCEGVLAREKKKYLETQERVDSDK